MQINTDVFKKVFTPMECFTFLLLLFMNLWSKSMKVKTKLCYVVHHDFYCDCNMKSKEQTNQVREELTKNWKSGDNYKKRTTKRFPTHH